MTNFKKKENYEKVYTFIDNGIGRIRYTFL